MKGTKGFKVGTYIKSDGTKATEVDLPDGTVVKFERLYTKEEALKEALEWWY